MVINGFREFTRLAAAEGAVLLKNDKNVLPIKNEKTAVFGRCQIDYYKSGTGSGGAVNSKYIVNILEGFRNNERIFVDEKIAALYEELTKNTPDANENKWAVNLTDYEPEIEEEMIKKAAKRNDKAIIIIGRVAGEAYDTENSEGGYMLTKKERLLISRVGKYFEKFAVLLNCGNLINMQWVEEENVPCVMYIWQGGEEGGNAVADVVSGIIPPSGKLTDTIAKDYSLYPSSENFRDENELIYCEDIFVGYRYFETFAKNDVLYPFGFGLTYTKFEIVCEKVNKCGNLVEMEFSVKNTGNYEGRTVIQIYLESAFEKLTRPARELVAFAKTKTVKPSEEVKTVICFDISNTAAYDDEGLTGNESAWVLEKGTYNVYAGEDVRNAEKIYSYEIVDTTVINQLTKRMTPSKSFNQMINNGGKIGYKKANIRTREQFEYKKKEFLQEIEASYTKDFLSAVREGKIREFTGSMTDAELMTLSRGEGMLSPKVTPGVASCFGGVSDSLLSKGIPLACTSDGPSGIRMDNGESATSMPSGTLLASSWDPEMVEKLFEFAGKELCLNKIDMLLGPGMNIHRDPLCGRNFEYFSEDPLLTGIMGAANINGLHKGGSAGVIKHFACNNREYRRKFVNSVVSERALREIYLRGFEIVVKTSSVMGIMTSYNQINEYYTASNYDLTTSILRDEWGYDGLVMTDWYALMNYDSDDEASKKKLGAMAKAQNDLYMVVENFKAEIWDDDLKETLGNGILTRAELQRNAVNILTVISKLLCFEREYSFRIDSNSEKQQWFSSSSANREYKIMECPIPDSAIEKKAYVYVDNISTNNGVKMCYKAIGKASDEMKFAIHTPEDAMVEISLSVCADVSELAQLAIFVRLNDKEYPISFCGTNNDTIKVRVKVDLRMGYTDAVFAFAKSNVADIIIKEIDVNIVK